MTGDKVREERKGGFRSLKPSQVGRHRVKEVTIYILHLTKVESTMKKVIRKRSPVKTKKYSSKSQEKEKNPLKVRYSNYKEDNTFSLLGL